MIAKNPVIMKQTHMNDPSFTESPTVRTILYEIYFQPLTLLTKLYHYV